MKKKHKAYLKLNLVSLFFIAVSFISVTLAWFAYSGLSTTNMEVDVKTWYVEFEKNGQVVSNDIVISLSDIYPGMETVHETVVIRNKGDSVAALSYSIPSARILGEEIEIVSEEYVIDKLSHDYPFNINISVSDNFILNAGGESVFDVSISWPLDSGNDENDSLWGSKAYEFQENEQKKYEADKSYTVMPSINVVINVKAEQLIENSDDSSDINYVLGDSILFDVNSLEVCESLSTTCLKTYVIDTNNKIGDDKVTLLLDLYDNYSTGSYTNYNSLLSSYSSSWKIKPRSLNMNDVMNIISKDIRDSVIVTDKLSDRIIGYVGYSDRLKNIISDTINTDSYFRFLNDNFNYLATNKCYWLTQDYDANTAFILTKIDDTYSKVFGESINVATSTDETITSCSIAPVIEVSKDYLIKE